MSAPAGTRVTETCPTHLKLELGRNGITGFSGNTVKANGTHYTQERKFYGCQQRDITFDNLQACKKYEVQVASFHPRMENGAWVMATSPQVNSLKRSLI